jgi:formylglycine-generating enzyme required for sulfatase activity
MKFVLIPAGEFQMGSNELNDEKPVHTVKITKAFYMQTTEVTQKQWTAVMGNNPSYFKGDDLPVERVSWNDAQEFIKKLNAKEGKDVYRLPTEAEWEYACRAGTTTPFSFGETITTDQVNYDGNYPYGNGAKGEYRQKTTPAGSLKANKWGLYDMHGNVWEWCEDWYGDSYYSSSPTDNPKGAGSGTCRFLRGGGWDADALGCRSADRDWLSPVDSYSVIGFRLSCSVSARIEEKPSKKEEQSEKPEIKKEITNSIGQKFVLIPAGEFQMGSPASEANRSADETQHKVKITKSFYMQTTEVTQKQWQAVMGNNPSYFKGDDLPIKQVSWNDVQEFITKLNAQDKGKSYRLPTEAEWEYACRAGSSGEYCFGDNEGELGEYAWFDGNSGNKTHRIGTREPNKWRLYDMHGNVWEWCQDWYESDYYGSSPMDNPTGPSSGVHRVLRGGGWYDVATGCRSACRFWGTPDGRDDDLGFRVCCSSSAP